MENSIEALREANEVLWELINKLDKEIQEAKYRITVLEKQLYLVNRKAPSTTDKT